MKTIAIFGKELDKVFFEDIGLLLDYLEKKEARVLVNKKFYEKFRDIFGRKGIEAYSHYSDLTPHPDLFISIGGDGTFLDSALFVRDSGVPVVGINTGRLGFLARISSSDIKTAMDDFYAGRYSIRPRTLITLETKDDLFGEDNFALNELTVHKNDDASMIIIHAFLDGEYLNSYWADGLIVSTPTGSTAYSMSVGGPIILPGSGNFVISPVAPHNLTVRPIVIPDDFEIKLQVEGRGSNYLVSLDSRIERIDPTVELTLRKSSFTINLIEFPSNTYLKTLRDKLLWGIDKRNWQERF